MDLKQNLYLKKLDLDYKMYEFEPNTIFLRDVDAEPKLMKENDFLQNTFLKKG